MKNLLPVIPKFSNYFFIADTHLNQNNCIYTENFLEIIVECKKTSDSCLIILGDFLDFWFENSGYDISAEYPMFGDIKKNVLNYPVFLIRGNRDFLAGACFEKNTGIKIIGDEALLNIEKKKIYLTHGDILCTNDRSYQLWRYFSRNKWIIFAFKFVPKNLCLKIIKKMRIMSAIKKARQKMLNLSIVIDEVKKKIREYEVDAVICGHNHIFRCMKFGKPQADEICNKNIQIEKSLFLVLHKMHKWGTYILRIDSTGVFEFIVFTAKKN